MITRYLIFAAMFISQWTTAQDPFPMVSSGRIDRIKDFPSTYVTPRTVDIWLPENYSKSSRYAVIYMHDGQMLFDSTMTWNRQEWLTDETVARLVRNKKIRNCIVVAIWNIPEKRYAEYFPQKVWEHIDEPLRSSLAEKTMKAEPMADDYLKFIVKELKTYIDEKYSTHKDVNNTFIMGSSMGGLISLYALCEYPKVFGGAACMSTHTPLVMYDLLNDQTDKMAASKFRNYLRENLPKSNTRKIYFDYGDQTGDSFYEPYQKAIDQIMVEKAWKKTHWITRLFPGESHSEKSWAKRLEVPLIFLLGR